MTLKQAIKDPSWLLARMSNQKVEGNDGPGFRHVRCPKMLWEDLVRLVEGLKVEEGASEMSPPFGACPGCGADNKRTDSGTQCSAGCAMAQIKEAETRMDEHKKSCMYCQLDSFEACERGKELMAGAAQHLKREQEPVTPDGWISIKRSFYDELLMNSHELESLTRGGALEMRSPPINRITGYLANNDSLTSEQLSDLLRDCRRFIGDADKAFAALAELRSQK